MRRFNKLLLLAGLAASQGLAANFSYTGNFAKDDDKREFFFTLSSAGTVILRTYSYAGGTNAAGTKIPGGGFDPSISLFDASNTTLGVNRDGGCDKVGVDAVTSSCWDSYLTAQLPAGTYRVLLTQSDNVPNGPGLADSFYFDGMGNFTQAPGNAAPGFWDYFPSQRTGAYALDILGANSSLAPMVTSSATLPPATTLTGYNPVTLTAVGGPGANYTWSVVPSARTSGLPGGMSLTPAGVVQGTPAANGTYTFIAQATDGIQPLQQTVTLAVYDPIKITTSALPGGTAGQSYGPFTATATGGSGSYVWSSPNLPSALSISAAGKISGTPSVGGSFPVTITVNDATAGQMASAALNITIGFPPLLISGSGSLPEVAVGGSVSATFSATGGNPPYTWSANGVPPGVTINSGTGVLSGNPSQPGNYNFTVQVADTASGINSVGGSVSVLGITTSSLPGATTTSPYSQTISAAGGVPPYTFSASGVPAGLTLSGSGVLSGTAKAANTYSLGVQVRDGAGVVASGALSLVVTGPSPLTVLGGALTDGTLGTAYSDSVKAVGGAPGYTWLVTGGMPPDGLSIGSNGAVSGTPTKIGLFTFTAQATDTANTSASGTFTIAIGAGPLTLTSGTLPAGVVGSDYPLQILPASGGLPPYTFSITTGSLPAGLNLANGQISGLPTGSGSSTFMITATDSSVPAKTAMGTFGIVIKPAQADLIISSTSLPFSLMTGAVGLPTPDNVTVRSSVILQLLNYTVAVTPAVAWLDVTSGGTTPGSISVALDPSALNLPVGPYQTSIVVTCVAPSPCAGNAQTIAVSLAVTAPPPQLTLTSSLLSFTSSPMNPAPPPQTLGVQNTGGGTLGISKVTAADPWVSVTGVPGTLPSGPAVPATVTVNPAGLTAGYYQSSITVTSSGGTSSVPVTLLVAPNTTMTLLPAGGQFQGPAGNAPGNPSGSFAVSSSGNSNVNWSASVLPGATWLSVSSPNGVSTNAMPGTVNFALDPTVVSNLAPKTYYGLIRVTSGDVVDSPQDFEVVLNVQPAPTPVKPDPEPAGISISAVSGSGVNPSFPVQVYASSTTALPYQASASTSDGNPWLSVSPATGTASTAAPGASTISFTPGKLPAGVYRGGVSYAFSSAAVRTVNVTLIVRAPAATLTGLTPGEVPNAAGACAPTRLAPTQTGLVTNFAQPAAWPTPLAIRLLDDCGSPVPQGQVVVTFSNGDPPLALTAVDTASGNYSGTWTPRSVSPQVTILARTTAQGFPAATTQITGEVTSNAAPLLTPNGTLHVFDPLVGGSLGPGNIVQIYGSNLAAQAVVSSAVPLSTNLGGTTVLIGGIPSPLYYVSPGQINAQVPFELSAGNKYQIIVSANGALATPDTLQLTAVSPGIAAFPSGQIIAQHLDTSLVTETSPAKPGEIVVFYLAGLGATDNPVVTGAGSPGTPLARPQDPPVVTLNGAKVPVLFAGLTPGLVGLYQINLQLPANAPDGDLQLVVTQSGAPSNSTILPVHH